MNAIKKARLETGLTRAELAKRMEIPYRTFEDWEQGKSYPKQYIERLILKEIREIKNTLLNKSEIDKT